MMRGAECRCTPEALLNIHTVVFHTKKKKKRKRKRQIPPADSNLNVTATSEPIEV